MPPVNAWLVRHGQSSANAGLPTENHAEAALTDLGRQQAATAAERVERQPDILIVSPYLRARQTAEPIRLRWPEVRCETWPIHEFTYLSPALCEGSTVESRRPLVADYWQRADPDYTHGPDAESFRQFIERVRAFHDRLLELSVDFAIAVGHGQFFRAFAFGLSHGFEASSQQMQAYRAAETADPMANGQIMILGRDAFRT